MALDATELAAIMTKNVLAESAKGPLATIDPLLKAIAEAVVQHIKDKAEVLPLSPTPLITGTGPVTGKGSII